MRCDCRRWRSKLLCHEARLQLAAAGRGSTLDSSAAVGLLSCDAECSRQKVSIPAPTARNTYASAQQASSTHVRQILNLKTRDAVYLLHISFQVYRMQVMHLGVAVCIDMPVVCSLEQANERLRLPF